MSENYTIAEASSTLNVSHRTLHYYEKFFNLNINRDSSGARLYTEEDLNILDLIINFKKNGLKLDAIKKQLEKKGLIHTTDDKDIIVYDERYLKLKDLIIDDLVAAVGTEINGKLKKVTEDLAETKELLNTILDQNTDLQKQLTEHSINIDRQSEEHFKILDEKLSEWRKSEERSWNKKDEKEKTFFVKIKIKLLSLIHKNTKNA